jgi:predicted NBD/HSP70 family sugar kinase
MVTEGLLSTSPTTLNGRRAISVSLLGERASIAVGIGFGRRHLRVVLVSPDYRVLAEDSQPVPQGYHASEGMELAKRLISRLLGVADVAESALLGIGIGLPGAINQQSREPVPGTVPSGWEGYDLYSELEERFGVPVFADNDANLGAVAELLWGPFGRASNLIYLKIGTGIGSGLILNGIPFGGAGGVTGEVGHFEVVKDGRPCRCGNRGCLESESSTFAMIERSRASHSELNSTEQLLDYARAGDVAVARVIEDAALHIGHVLGDLASILNPEVIVIGGPLAALGDLILAPIRHGFARRVLPAVTDATMLAMSDLNDRGEALGGAVMVFRQAARLNES